MVWLQCIAVGAVWGLTNAMMRVADDRYTAGATVWANWRWWLCFACNQIGSLLFYFTLRDADISLVVPICQVTTLAFTCIGAILFNEQRQQQRGGDLKWTFMGLVFVTIGVIIMRFE